MPSLFNMHVPTAEECKQHHQKREYEEDMYNTKTGQYGTDMISEHVWKYWKQWVAKKGDVYVVVYECPLKTWNKKKGHGQADKFLGKVYDAVVSEVHGKYHFGRINGSTFALLTTSSSTKSAAKNVDFDDCGFGHYEPEVSTKSWGWVKKERVKPLKGGFELNHDSKVGLNELMNDKEWMKEVKKSGDMDCIFIDIDNMSWINGKGKYKGSRSHGNKVVERVWRIAEKHAHVVMKVGGDEFRCTAKKGRGKSVANKIRMEVRENLRYQDGKKKVTVTLGVGRTPKEAQYAQEKGKGKDKRDEVHMHKNYK